MNLTQKIEGYLFYTGEPVAIKSLAKVFGVTEGQVADALLDLEAHLVNLHRMFLNIKDFGLYGLGILVILLKLSPSF